MKQATDPLSSLIAPAILPHLEQMSLPYLGYHFLRDNLTQKLLGESEAPILFWLGKDLGENIVIQKTVDLTFAFIRLGLGKLEVAEGGEKQYSFTLHHSYYSFSPIARLEKSLSFECGIITGALGRWLGKRIDTHFEISTDGTDKHHKKTAKITAQVQE